MFHPRLVRGLIQEYSKEGDLVLDPFLGSGVTAVESAVSRRAFYGWDINPLAVLISEVRSTPLKREAILDELNEIRRRYSLMAPHPPAFPNIDFWFSPTCKESLSRLVQSIAPVEDRSLRNFFLVCLSETIRAVSWTKPHEFKLVRQEKPQQTPTFSLFRANVLKNMRALTGFYSFYRIKIKPHILRLNTLTDSLPLKDGSVSLLLTSPPYGDSQTTVAYGQFSRLSLQWIGLPHEWDKESLGAKRAILTNEVPSRTLHNSLDRIYGVDRKRASQVYSFYLDLYRCMIRLVPKVKPHGYLIFVLGNRTVKGVSLPTDIIITELLQVLGVRHLLTRIRQIGNKRMPSENSPTNIPGERGPTMKYEYVVICKKG